MDTQSVGELDKKLLTYSTREVVAISGATPRQLQYWCEQKWIRGVRIDGSRRAWRPDHIRKATVLAKISESGQEWATRAADMATEIFRKRFLLFTSKRELICATDDKREIIKAGSASRCGVILIDLGVYA